MERPTVFVQVVFKGESKIIQVNHSTKHFDIADQIRGEWPNLWSETFQLFYKLGSMSKCCLSSDVDVSTLINIAVELGEKFVGVEVCTTNNKQVSPSNRNLEVTNKRTIHYPKLTSSSPETENVVVDVLGAAMKVRKISGDGPEFSRERTLPRFDMCPELVKIPLLSDPWKKCIWGNGQQFKGGANEFRDEIIKYTTKNGFQFDFHKNTPIYIQVNCRERGGIYTCDWVLKGKALGVTKGFVMYDSMLEHNCVGKLVNKDCTRLGARIIGKLILVEVKSMPLFGGAAVKILIKTSYGFDITYSQSWRGLEFARNIVYGSFDESFNDLVWYTEGVRRTNPGSIAIILPNRVTNRFEKMFIVLKGCMEGFKSCRPMLIIDGTFMNGRWGGTMLSATAKDGNNGIFPVAFAVVASETTETWTWFLQMIKDHIHHDCQIFFVSDRHCGILAAFPLVWEKPCHFFCLVHLFKNLKTLLASGRNKTYRSDMCELLKEAAYAPNKVIFQVKLDKFKEMGGQKVVDWLTNLPYEKWALSHSPDILRYGEMTSNGAESFNSWILEARSLPVTYMIDFIRAGIMRWFVERRTDSDMWSGVLCPQKEEVWNTLCDYGSTWNVFACPDGSFAVSSQPSVTVNLSTRTCSCYQWQVTGFPCAHAASVIRKHCKTIDEAVLPCFLAKAYRDAYSHNIYAVPQTERFECQVPVGTAKILPLPPKGKMGRPKHARYRSALEPSKRKASFCTLCCKVVRHDEFTCALARA